MLEILSLGQFIELYNRTFREEQPLSVKDFSGTLNEQSEKDEYLSRVGSLEKDEVKRVYNVAAQIRSRRNTAADDHGEGTPIARKRT